MTVSCETNIVWYERQRLSQCFSVKMSRSHALRKSEATVYVQGVGFLDDFAIRTRHAAFSREEQCEYRRPSPYHTMINLV